MKKVVEKTIVVAFVSLLALPIIATAAPDKTATAVSCLEQIVTDLRQNKIGFNQ